MTATATKLATMPDKVSINVTAEHIAKGRKCAAATCPIALAIIEALANYGIYTVSVGPWKPRIDSKVVVHW